MLSTIQIWKSVPRQQDKCKEHHKQRDPKKLIEYSLMNIFIVYNVNEI